MIKTASARAVAAAAAATAASAILSRKSSVVAHRSSLPALPARRLLVCRSPAVAAVACRMSERATTSGERASQRARRGASPASQRLP